MTRSSSLSLVLALLLASGFAAGQRPGERRPEGPASGPDVQKRLVRLFDRNHDGKLNRMEWNRARRVLRELKPDRPVRRHREGGVTPRRQRSRMGETRESDR